MSEERKILLPSALSVYERAEQSQLNYEDIGRTDMHFRMKTGADILIEELGVHVQNPFKFSTKDLCSWSQKQNDNIDIVLQSYSNHFENVKLKYENELKPVYRPYISTDGFADSRDFSKFSADEKLTEISKINREAIVNLRKTDGSIDAIAEIDHRRNNLLEILYHKRHKNLDDLVLKTYGDELTMTNRVTILQNYRERGPKPNPKSPDQMLPATYSHKQRTYTIGEMIEMLQSPELNKRAKADRLLVIPNTTGDRQVGDIAYTNWCGLQIFDIDLKFSPTFISKNLDAGEIRDTLFEKLQHYPWLLGITLSSSGKALHIYTKVSRPHNLFKQAEHNIDIAKYWYRMSYIQKYAAICYVLFHECDVDVYEENERKGEKVVDSAMARVQQGIAMNYDPEAKFNSNFVDLPPMLFYDLPPEKGIELTDWIDTPHIDNVFTAWYYDNASNDEDNVEVTKRTGSLKINIDENYKLGDISAIDMDSLSKGEKYSTRWRVCNTLIASYGDTPQATELANHILQADLTGTHGQIQSFLRSAVLNRKEADVYMLQQLSDLGLKIGLDEESKDLIADENMERIRFMVEKSNYAFRQHNPDVLINLDNNEYLGMRMKDILNSFDQYKVNVIESAPNTGKTEFFKALARKEPVCLIIPFTSTIEAKIVNDESICELFDVYYGDKSVTDIVKGRSAVMTFDKFSKLPKSKYKLFNYFAIDESHLLFTSTYRLPVVSQTVENLRTYLLKDTAILKDSMSSVLSVQKLLSYVHQPETTIDLPKIILMTGTLTAELDYFRYYDLLNYIKIYKKHPHKKNVEFVLSKSSATRDILLAEHIAEVLKRGGKIIHPTNNGDGYARKVIEYVEFLLGRSIIAEYYKRSNTDEEFVDRINRDTTVDAVELLFCSDYLSVGIDIKDIGDFEFVYSSDFTAESIEQFNNRLRSTDITCKIFFDVLTEDGMQKPNIMNLQQIEYKANAEFRNMLQDELTVAKLQQHVGAKQTYHAVIGEMFSKYFVQDMFGNIKYIQAAFEIERFEESYKTIARSLLYIKTSLEKKFQYVVDVTFKPEREDDEIERFKEIQKEAKRQYDLARTKSVLDIITYITEDQVYNIMTNESITKEKFSEELKEGEIGLHVGYNPNEDVGGFLLSYHRSHKSEIDYAVKLGLELRKMYAHETVKQLMLTFIDTKGLLKRIEVKRYLNLMRLMFDDRKSMIAQNTSKLLEIIYEHLPATENHYKIERWEFEAIRQDLRAEVMRDVISITEADFVSERRIKMVDNLIDKLIDTLFFKRIGKESVTISFRKILTFDSESINERILRDQIFNQLIVNDFTEIKANAVKYIAETHITDDTASLGKSEGPQTGV